MAATADPPFCVLKCTSKSKKVRSDRKRREIRPWFLKRLYAQSFLRACRDYRSDIWRSHAVSSMDYPDDIIESLDQSSVTYDAWTTGWRTLMIDSKENECASDAKREPHPFADRSFFSYGIHPDEWIQYRPCQQGLYCCAKEWNAKQGRFRSIYCRGCMKFLTSLSLSELQTLVQTVKQGFDNMFFFRVYCKFPELPDPSDILKNHLSFRVYKFPRSEKSITE